MPLSPLLEVLTKAAGYLREKGVPQARLDAELLLARVLEAKRLDLYLQFDRPLTDPELAAYRALVRRRGLREPLQHILGEVEFRELRLKTDRRALIPRSETELLVDILKRHLPTVESPRILDIGVGTGAIALSVLREMPHCRVFACDIEASCLELTRENAVLNQLPEPQLFQGSLFSPFPENIHWHAVVSNPPYVGEKEALSLQPEVRDFDPRSALIGGPEGWELPLELLFQAYGRIEPGGLLIMEIDPSQFPLLKERALNQGWGKGVPDLREQRTTTTAAASR
jgi:release factor glutamine methyltransferase